MTTTVCGVSCSALCMIVEGSPVSDASTLCIITTVSVTSGVPVLCNVIAVFDVPACEICLQCLEL
jgi:hypothetical protein